MVEFMYFPVCGRGGIITADSFCGSVGTGEDQVLSGSYGNLLFHGGYCMLRSRLRIHGPLRICGEISKE